MKTHSAISVLLFAAGLLFWNAARLRPGPEMPIDDGHEATALRSLFAGQPTGRADAALLAALYEAIADAVESEAGRRLIKTRPQVEQLVVASATLGKDWQVGARYPQWAVRVEKLLTREWNNAPGALTEADRVSVARIYRSLSADCRRAAER